MSLLQASLFGKFRLRVGEETYCGLGSQKSQELFCYLLLCRNRPHSRELLASLLWADHSTSQSKSYLRKALWQLQSNLDPLVNQCDVRPLVIEPEWIQLDVLTGLWLDVAVLEEAFSGVQGVPGRLLSIDEAQVLKNAVELYQGDLLEGWYQEWCLHERERLHQILLCILDKLMSYCEANQEYEAGLAYGLRVLHCDRAREYTHRHLMRLRYLAGDRTGALHQYEQCAATLAEELGIEPEHRTEVLYLQIKAGRLDQGSAETSSSVRATSLQKVRDHLKRLEATLMSVQEQVHRELEAVQSDVEAPHLWPNAVELGTADEILRRERGKP
jgi:DNA-binding SARP family transcriptional activator